MRTKRYCLVYFFLSSIIKSVPDYQQSCVFEVDEIGYKQHLKVKRNNSSDDSSFPACEHEQKLKSNRLCLCFSQDVSGVMFAGCYADVFNTDTLME